MSPLGTLRQEDFSAGEQRNVAPHLIDPRGLYEIANGLLNDDGSVYRRGGSVAVSAALGTHMRNVWDGWLQPGRRTFLASSDRFGVMPAEGNVPVNLGGPGQTVPLPPRVVQDLLFIPGASGLIYGGSRKAADYLVGKVKVTKGSSTVEGVGTSWLANVDAGMLLRISAEDRVYVVAAVTSDTQLTIRDPYEGATAEVEYSLRRLEAAVAAKRLIACSGNVVIFTESGKPHVLKATIPPQETVVENKHEIEEGANIIAAESLGVDKALVFHTRGVTSFANLSASIVDALGASQHRIDKVSSDIIAWGPAGITGYRNSLVVPAMDNVYLMDGTSSPVPLSHSIAKTYQGFVEEGFTPGGAWVHRDHYFLPILDAAGDPQALLSVRLDRPYDTRGQTFFPWSAHTGSGAAVSAGAVRSTSAPGDVPAVYAACGDGKLLNLATFFTPEAAVKTDHDGTAALFRIVTRDFPAGELSIGRFRRLRLLYELEALEEDDALITAEIGTGIRKEQAARWDEVNWDEFDWAASDEETQFELLEQGAPPNAGDQSALAQNAWVWYLNTRARYVRFRLQASAPTAKLTIRSLEIFVAQQGGVRQAKVVDS
jgi:hypothetical protein